MSAESRTASRGRTPKAARTRERLLAAARTVFERHGYFDARVADVVAEAGVAHGTFYTYFESKEDVFIAVAERVTDSLFEVYRLPSGLDPVERIHETNRRYLELYEQNAPMLGLLDQVAPTSDRLREMRTGIRHGRSDLLPVVRHARALRPGGDDRDARQDLDQGARSQGLAGDHARLDDQPYDW